MGAAKVGVTGAALGQKTRGAAPGEHPELLYKFPVN